MRLPTAKYLEQIVEFYDAVEKIGIHVKSKGHYIDYPDLISDLGAVWNTLPTDTKAHLALLYTEVALKYDISKAKRVEKHKTKVPLCELMRQIYFVPDDLVHEHLAFDFETKKFVICHDTSPDKWHFKVIVDNLDIDKTMRLLNRYRFRPYDTVEEFLRQKFTVQMIGGKISGIDTQILLLSGE